MSRIVVVLLFFAAAIVRGASAQAEARAKSEAGAQGPQGNYVLQPQDLIRVEVFQEEDLKRELRISQECTISLPLIGNLDLKNKTVRQAEDMIRKLYDGDYLVNPQINLTVLEYAPRSVQVLGQVNNQGVVFFPKEERLTLLKAISLAGGFTRLANKKQVTLKRALPDGRVETNRIDADELTKGESSETWPLQPGDVINVPEKII